MLGMTTLCAIAGVGSFVVSNVITSSIVIDEKTSIGAFDGINSSTLFDEATFSDNGSIVSLVNDELVYSLYEP